MSCKNDKQITFPRENWIIAENIHEPIIGETLFNKVQELLKIRTKSARNTGQVYLFSGLLKCGDCNCTMDRTTNRKPNGKVYVNYHCSTYFRRLREACTTHTIPEHEIESAVLAVIQKQIAALIDCNSIIEQIDWRKHRNTQINMIDKQLSSKQRELDDTERIKMGLYTDLKKDIITQDEYASLKSGYTEKTTQLNNSIPTLKAERDNLENQTAAQNEWLERFVSIGNIDKLTRGLVVELIDKIYIYEGKRIAIQFKFADEFESLQKLIQEEVISMVG